MVGYFLQQQQQQQQSQQQQQQQQQQQRTHEDIYAPSNKRWSSLSDNNVLNSVTHVSDLEKKFHTLAMADPNPGELFPLPRPPSLFLATLHLVYSSQFPPPHLSL